MAVSAPHSVAVTRRLCGPELFAASPAVTSDFKGKMDCGWHSGVLWMQRVRAQKPFNNPKQNIKGAMGMRTLHKLRICQTLRPAKPQCGPMLNGPSILSVTRRLERPVTRRSKGSGRAIPTAALRTSSAYIHLVQRPNKP